MILQMHNFGDILMSRPAGKEAFFMAKAYILGQTSPDEVIVLDFSEVKVLAPSWADEFIKNIKSTYPNKVEYLNTENESVKESLKWVS